MIICDVCKDDVSAHSLGINKLVYGLMPVTVSTTGYSRAEWVDSDDGMTQFIHDKCLESLIKIGGRTYKNA